MQNVNDEQTKQEQYEADFINSFWQHTLTQPKGKPIEEAFKDSVQSAAEQIFQQQEAEIARLKQALEEIVYEAATYEHTNSVHDQAFHHAVQDALDVYADIAREALAAKISN